MIVAAALLLAVAQADGGRSVTVEQRPDDRCIVTVEGRSFDVERDQAAFEAFLAQSTDTRWRIVSRGSMSYRCVGGVIYRMQRHGVEQMDVVAAEAEAR